MFHHETHKVDDIHVT